jgi:heptosyltransferase II
MLLKINSLSIQSPQRILLVKNRALGDSLMGLATLQALLHQFPSAKIYYALPAWILPLFKSYSHSRVEFVPLKLSNPIESIETYLIIRALKIDVIYEMHAAGRTRRFFNWISRLSSIPYGLHNHHLKTETGVKDQGLIKPLIQRDLDGASSFFQTMGDWNYLDYEPVFHLSIKKRPVKRVLLGVVATRETKMYPLDFYLEFARLINFEDPEVELVIPLSQSLDDQKIKKYIQQHPESSYVKIVQLPLEDLPHYFAQSWCYVGNDTGLKHLAIAVGLRAYTLFGPEPPLEWHPYNKERHPYYFREPLECRTRTHHYCGLKHCESMICLNEFSARDLFYQFKQMHF